MKILLTNQHLADLAGSEITTLETAIALREMGFDVSVATFYYENPIREAFERNRIKVYNLFYESLPHKTFDLAWCHHTPVITHVLNLGIRFKKVVFRTLSFMVALEALPFFVDEVDVVLAVSGATAEKYVSNGWIEKDRIQVMPNSVLDGFFAEAKERNRPHLEKIAVVSNHPPREVMEAVEQLRKRSLSVQVIGKTSPGSYQLVTPEWLGEYDLLVTIGKTVQYGMAMKIPVYCYDRFGGPGYLTRKNFEKAAYHNFSGRCGQRKISPQKITKEILTGYSDALEQVGYFRQIAQRRYDLKKNIGEVLVQIEKRKVNQVFYERLFNREIRMQIKHNEYYLKYLRKAYLFEKKMREMEKQVKGREDG
jgi:hypothetical protein